MIKFCSLVSGSSGNSVYLEYKNTRLLIDCGVSSKRICENLAAISTAPQDISAILITHEHVDHVSGISVFSKKYNTPVYATESTWNEMTSKKPVLPALHNLLQAGNTFEIGDITVEAFSIPHDAADPVGYTFYIGNKKLSVATDMGKIDAAIAEKLRGSYFVMLESNHDTQMLLNGPYPYHLKKRVAGEKGHLSNDQAAKLAAALARTGTSRILLGHLSATNNSPSLALQTTVQYLKEQSCEVGKDIQIDVAGRYCRSSIYNIIV